MSVLVNGMNMPESCLSCPFQQWDGEDTVCYFTGISALNIGRQGACPLVPVPPHGRLIDADALWQSLKESIDECHKWAVKVEGVEMYARVSQSLATFVECSLRVKAAPTIIEAEEVNT